MFVFVGLFFVGNAVESSNIWGFIFSEFYYMMVEVDGIVTKNREEEMEIEA